jgi:hypothetical protein
MLSRFDEGNAFERIRVQKPAAHLAAGVEITS